MQAMTCAACDCELDDTRIAVRIGGRVVEVCCEDCAIALREAFLAIEAGPSGMRSSSAATARPSAIRQRH